VAGALSAEAAILAVLEARAGSICPSEAARHLDPKGWRDRMADIHRAARKLAAEGVVLLTQKGRPVLEPAGPYRVRKP
jgi:hypothetical protein